MKHGLTCAGVVTLLLAAAPSGQTTIVADVRAAIARSDLKAADALVADFRRSAGTTPDALEALSWLGRGALAAGDHDRAMGYAQETRRLAVAMLKDRALDADKNLPV